MQKKKNAAIQFLQVDMELSRVYCNISVREKMQELADTHVVTSNQLSW